MSTPLVQAFLAGFHRPLPQSTPSLSPEQNEALKKQIEELFSVRKEDRTLNSLYEKFPELYRLIEVHKDKGHILPLLASHIAGTKWMKSAHDRALDAAAFEISDFKRAGGSNPSTREFETILRQGVNSGKTYKENMQILIPKALNEAIREYKKRAATELQPLFSNAGEYRLARDLYIRQQLLNDPFVAQMFSKAQELGIDVNHILTQYDIKKRKPREKIIIKEISEETPRNHEEKQEIIEEEPGYEEITPLMKDDELSGISSVANTLGQLPVGIAKGLAHTANIPLSFIKDYAQKETLNDLEDLIPGSPRERLLTSALGEKTLAEEREKVRNTDLSSLDFVKGIEKVQDLLKKDLGIDTYAHSGVGRFLERMGENIGLILSSGTPTRAVLKNLGKILASTATQTEVEHLLDTLGDNLSLNPAVKNLLSSIGGLAAQHYTYKGLSQVKKPLTSEQIRESKIYGTPEDLRRVKGKVHEQHENQIKELLKKPDIAEKTKNILDEETRLEKAFRNLEKEAKTTDIDNKLLKKAYEEEIGDIEKFYGAGNLSGEAKEVVSHLKNRAAGYKKSVKIQEKQLLHRIEENRKMMRQAYDPVLPKSQQSVSYQKALKERNANIKALKKINPELASGLEDTMEGWSAIQKQKDFEAGIDGLWNTKEEIRTVKNLSKDLEWAKNARAYLGEKNYKELRKILDKISSDRHTLQWISDNYHKLDTKLAPLISAERLVGKTLTRLKYRLGRVVGKPSLSLKELIKEASRSPEFLEGWKAALQGVQARNVNLVRQGLAKMEKALTKRGQENE